MDEMEWTRRAVAAYFRVGKGEQVLGDPVTANSVVKYGGKVYVVLRDSGGGLLAVFRLRNEGRLKRLRRWPVGLEAR